MLLFVTYQKVLFCLLKSTLVFWKVTGMEATFIQKHKKLWSCQILFQPIVIFRFCPEQILLTRIDQTKMCKLHLLERPPYYVVNKGTLKPVWSTFRTEAAETSKIWGPLPIGCLFLFSLSFIYLQNLGGMTHTGLTSTKRFTNLHIGL